LDSGESGGCVIPGCTSATISITDVMVTVTYSDGSPVTDQRVTAVMSDGTEVDWPNSDDQGQADEFVAAGAYKFEVVVNGNAYDSGPDGHCVVPGCRTATIVVGGGCSGQPDGTACDDGSACTQTDTCQGGACMGGNSVTCVASDQCHSAGTCDPASGTCSNPAKTDGTACNDGNACTQSDICQNGACTGGNPVICTAQDQCHLAGTCNPSTGTCSTPAAANGTACNDGNACTQTDICQSGTCTGGNSVTCTASDQCHGVGSCNQSTGVCSNPTLTNGTTCNDGNACTTGETCQSGSCTGGTTLSCSGADACHTVGACVAAIGCPAPVAKADGTTCDDSNACTQHDLCTNGVCAGTPVAVCGLVAPPLDPTIATNFLAATSFLYSGSNPVQTGVAPGTINPLQVTVIRGRVATQSGAPLAGVSISIHSHSEFGNTVTRADGMFDIAVNSVTYPTLDYQLSGYLPSQRQVVPRPRDYSWA